MAVEQQIEFVDDAAAEQAYADALAVVVKVQGLCIRLEQANDKLEQLQTVSGCSTFEELMAFVARHADDGK